MGVNLPSMGDVNPIPPDCEVVTHLDPAKGVYKKLVLRDNKLAGAVLLGAVDTGHRLMTLFKSAAPLNKPALDFLTNGDQPDDTEAVRALTDDAQICNCNIVSKGRLIAAIRDGNCTVNALGACTRPPTACGTCHPLIAQLL